ncbi:hypothetical protein NMY22_g10780 [Coprinellus aureogranulatus]|nr:hypothetical protein NMY22_g10780 [Coprinellus aureogranulatus]
MGVILPAYPVLFLCGIHQYGRIFPLHREFTVLLLILPHLLTPTFPLSSAVPLASADLPPLPHPPRPAGSPELSSSHLPTKRRRGSLRKHTKGKFDGTERKHICQHHLEHINAAQENIIEAVGLEQSTVSQILEPRASRSSPIGQSKFPVTEPDQQHSHSRLCHSQTSSPHRRAARHLQGLLKASSVRTENSKHRRNILDNSTRNAECPAPLLLWGEPSTQEARRHQPSQIRRVCNLYARLPFSGTGKPLNDSDNVPVLRGLRLLPRDKTVALGHPPPSEIDQQPQSRVFRPPQSS